MVLPLTSLFILLYWHIDNQHWVERKGEKGGHSISPLWEVQKGERDFILQHCTFKYSQRCETDVILRNMELELVDACIISAGAFKLIYEITYFKWIWLQHTVPPALSPYWIFLHLTFHFQCNYNQQLLNNTIFLLFIKYDALNTLEA